jgi:hypothetical protein
MKQTERVLTGYVYDRFGNLISVKYRDLLMDGKLLIKAGVEKTWRPGKKY